MTNLLIVGAVVLGYGLYYFVFMKRGGGAAMVQRTYGLRDGENMVDMLSAATLMRPATAKDVAKAAGLAVLGMEEVPRSLTVLMLDSDQILIHDNEAGTGQRFSRSADLLQLKSKVVQSKSDKFFYGREEDHRVVGVGGFDVVIKESDVPRLTTWAEQGTALNGCS